MKTVSKICKNLMIKEPYYGFFFLGLNKRFSKQIPTACVFKQNINFALEINQDYWNTLDENLRYGLVKHELLHLVFFHLFMMKDFKDKKLFNIAADLEVNQYIPENCLSENWVLLSSFPTMNLPPKAGTKFYYEMLDQNLKSNNSDPGLQDFMDGDPGSDHSFWDAFEDLPDAEKKLIRSQLEYQMKESAKSTGRGRIPSELSTTIEELFKVKKPVFNWKAYFRRLLGTSYKIFTKKTYRKPSKRFSDSAGLKIKKKQRILVGIDTSGSVSNKELLEFFSEITHVYRSGVAVTIIECDAAIHRIYEYKGNYDGTITGRGRTKFYPVIDYYNEHRSEYTTLIYFTDGGCPTNGLKPMKSMVWVLSSNGYADQKYPGYVIKIPKTDD